MVQNSEGTGLLIGLLSDPYTYPGIVFLLGIMGLVQTHVITGLQIEIYELLLTPPIGHWLLVLFGGLSMLSVRFAEERKENQLSEKESEQRDREKELRKKAEHIERKRRRMYRLKDFDDEYKSEPKRGQTEDGYIVYAGEARSDNVYALTKTDEEELTTAPRSRVEQIETALNNEDVDWLEEYDTAAATR